MILLSLLIAIIIVQETYMSGTVEFKRKMKSPPVTSAAETDFAPGTLPYERRLWRKKVLKVQLRNRHLLDRWGIKLTKFMECANRWSNGSVSKGSNHIPRFEIHHEDPDITVELNGKLQKYVFRRLDKPLSLQRERSKPKYHWLC